MLPTLKRCPHCRNHEVIVTSIGCYDEWAVGCVRCKALGPRGQSELEAVKLWNQRDYGKLTGKIIRVACRRGCFRDRLPLREALFISPEQRCPACTGLLAMEVEDEVEEAEFSQETKGGGT